MTGALVWLARHGRLLLVAGLIGGVTLPGAAGAMRPWLPELVAAMLFLAVLRIGPRQMLGTGREAAGSLRTVAAYQLAMPLAAAGALWAAGLLDSAAGLALVLVFAASPLSGSPNLTLMLGHEPAPALRLLIAGTALLPLTVLPVFWALPGVEGGGAVVGAAARLMAVIGGAAAAATALRVTVLPAPAARTMAALDGASALVMAVMVVGLMAPVGPALREAPGSLAAWLALACAVNLGAQAVAALLLRGRTAALVPLSVVAGNRNIALFLVALPESVSDRLLMFIGCYQVPMYLTPLLMAPLYRRLAGPPR